MEPVQEDTSKNKKQLRHDYQVFSSFITQLDHFTNDAQVYRSNFFNTFDSSFFYSLCICSVLGSAGIFLIFLHLLTAIKDNSHFSSDDFKYTVQLGSLFLGLAALLILGRLFAEMYMFIKTRKDNKHYFEQRNNHIQALVFYLLAITFICEKKSLDTKELLKLIADLQQSRHVDLLFDLLTEIRGSVAQLVYGHIREDLPVEFKIALFPKIDRIENLKPYLKNLSLFNEWLAVKDVPKIYKEETPLLAF